MTSRPGLVAALAALAVAAVALARTALPETALPETAIPESGPRSADDSASVSDVSADERAAWRRREAELLKRISELEEDLARERERRLAREAEWLEFTRALSALDVNRAPEPPGFARAPDASEGDGIGAEAAEKLERAAETARRRDARRADRIRVDLQAHLLAEQVLSLDVLEVGVLHDGWIGPVVIRTLDERGRPLGTLAAERLRLEASRSGHALTIVLEEGLERIAGQKIPFGPPTEEGSDRGGIRRLNLAGVDPRPWIESFPELFDPDVLIETPHDGSVDPLELRIAVDALLRGESSAGTWRLRELGGVLDGELRDVQLVELDRTGTVLRRLFADGLRVRRAGAGLELVLRDGVQIRGGRKAPFLQGIYRVFLPDANPETWARAAVPGL